MTPTLTHSAWNAAHFIPKIWSHQDVAGEMNNLDGKNCHWIRYEAKHPPSPITHTPPPPDQVLLDHSLQLPHRRFTSHHLRSIMKAKGGNLRQALKKTFYFRGLKSSSKALFVSWDVLESWSWKNTHINHGYILISKLNKNQPHLPCTFQIMRCFSNNW